MKCTIPYFDLFLRLLYNILVRQIVAWVKSDIRYSSTNDKIVKLFIDFLI